MRQRRGKYLLEPAGGFPVIPMIDVMLNLLVFFMLISHYLPPTLNITLPRASSAAPVDRPDIGITIDAQGRLAVDGQETIWDGLPALLAGRDPETLVRIAADKAADYDYVVRALDAAGQAGLPHVALEMQPQP